MTFAKKNNKLKGGSFNRWRLDLFIIVKLFWAVVNLCKLQKGIAMLLIAKRNKTLEIHTYLQSVLLTYIYTEWMYTVRFSETLSKKKLNDIPLKYDFGSFCAHYYAQISSSNAEVLERISNGYQQVTKCSCENEKSASRGWQVCVKG